MASLKSICKTSAEAFSSGWLPVNGFSDPGSVTLPAAAGPWAASKGTASSWVQMVRRSSRRMLVKGGGFPRLGNARSVSATGFIVFVLIRTSRPGMQTMSPRPGCRQRVGQKSESESFKTKPLVPASCGRRIRPGCMHRYFHRLAHPQQKVAGVLDPPFHVRDREVDIGNPVVGKHLHPYWHGQLVIRPMDGKNPVHLYRRCPAARHRSFHVVRTKRNLRKAVALQDFPMH